MKKSLIKISKHVKNIKIINTIVKTSNKVIKKVVD